MPLAQSDDYIKNIEGSFYKKFREHTYNNYREECGHEDYLYMPAVYYMLGNYDIAFISVIDSLKFAQNLFIPESGKSIDEDRFLHCNAFQTITGICLSHSCNGTDKELKNAFGRRILGDGKPGKIFFSAVNIKLNNGLLIGNGAPFFKKVINLLETELQMLDPSGKELDYFIVQSFSWYEINLNFFYDDINIMKKVVGRLRSLTLSDLGDGYEEFWSKSLYSSPPKGKSVNTSLPHLFIDTQTYTGIQYRYFGNIDKPGIKEKLQNIKFLTVIEWQLLPGYLSNLSEFLDKIQEKDQVGEKVKNVFDTAERYMLTGKSDYFFVQKEDNLYKKILLFEKLVSPQSSVREYVKKVKTRILLLDAEEKKEPEAQNEFAYFDLTRKLSVTDQEIEITMRRLKSLKISRQLSNKIKKILFSYNGGIEDQVLFTYYLDFSIFIREFIDEIKLHADRFDSYFKSPSEAWDKFIENAPTKKDKFAEFRVRNLEIKLTSYIDAFEKAHQVRALTSYQFEDITDLDLDFNMSIQQLLSVYSTIIVEMGNLFYPQYKYGPLVQLNLSNTLTNAINIQYNIYHLISPEFVFSTINMEILSYYTDINREDQGLMARIEDCNSSIMLLLKDNYYFNDFDENNLIDFKYFLLDSIRLIFSFNMDFSLFYYWFWTYNLQNSSLYSKRGLFDEDHFKTELLRLLFLSKVFFGLKSDLNNEACPIPELQTYWSRYYEKVSEQLDLIFRENETVIDQFTQLMMPILKEPLSKQLGSKAVYKEWMTKFNEGKNIDDTESKDWLIDLYTSKLDDGAGGAKDFIELLGRRKSCFTSFANHHKENLLQGIPIYIGSEHPALFISAIMHTYLKIIYELNGGKVHLLNRSWKDGEPLKPFIDTDTEAYLYSVDQLGGIFFNSPQDLNRYFSMRNGLLQSLWHFAYVQKINYIKNCGQ